MNQMNETVEAKLIDAKKTVKKEQMKQSLLESKLEQAEIKVKLLEDNLENQHSSRMKSYEDEINKLK